MLSGCSQLDLFKGAVAKWLCEPYSAEIKYIALKNGDSSHKILSCALFLWPTASLTPVSTKIYTSQIVAGHEHFSNISLKGLHELISGIESGNLELGNLSLTLEQKSELSFYSEMISNDRWFCDAHLIVRGGNQHQFSAIELANLNNELRLNDLPFDGVTDLLNYLQLPNCISSGENPRLEVRISPPIDLILNECHLAKGKLQLTLHAHPSLNLNDVSLALRTFSEGHSTRKQIAKEVEWVANGDKQIGIYKQDIHDAFASQAILMLAKNPVRRQFFDDITKVPNRRLSVLSFFDKELKRLKSCLAGTDAVAFEKAVNSLAYLLGFSGHILNESDAPDIILSSPNENLVIIECTTKVSDFENKLGKLVDRKNSLIKELENSGDSRKVYGYLICGLPRDQIVTDEKKLASHKVTLLTRESLHELLERLKFPENLEQLLIQDEEILENLLMQQTQ